MLPMTNSQPTRSTNNNTKTNTTSSATPATQPAKKAPRRTQGAADLRTLAPRQGVPLTLRDLATLHAAEHPCKRDSQTRIRKWLDDFKLGDLMAWDITREQVETGARMMAEQFGYACATVNRDIGELGTLYRWAAKKRLTPPGFNSPTIAIVREVEPMRVVEPARPGEWEHLRRLAKGFKDAKFTLMVWLVMDTGARRGEIADRSWIDFDLDAPEGPHLVLQAADVKTGKPRRLYFSHETAQLIRRLRPAERYRHTLVFVSSRGTTPNQYRKPWARLAELIGRPGLHLHDLRHMVAAELLKDGKGMSQVAQLLGHSSLVLHRRYGHLDDAAVRDMQAARLGLDRAPPAELPAVVQARANQAERDARAPLDAIAEAQRLQLIAQEAMAAAMAASQALSNMRGMPIPITNPAPTNTPTNTTGAQA